MAIKKRLFQNFEDYDGYSFYAASRLFFAIRKNYQNQGKVIKGKKIRPIKSCLNYMKALMYPMKVEYQNEAFHEVISEEFVSKKFDAMSYKEQLMEDAASSTTNNEMLMAYLQDTLMTTPRLIDEVLKKSPFQKDSTDYKRLKMSIMLNCVANLNNKKPLNWESPTVILWKLPKSMTSYVRVLIKEFYTTLKVELMDCYTQARPSEEILEKIISMPNGAGEDRE